MIPRRGSHIAHENAWYKSRRYKIRRKEMKVTKQMVYNNSFVLPEFLLAKVINVPCFQYVILIIGMQCDKNDML